jgi:hypothetical protein
VPTHAALVLAANVTIADTGLAAWYGCSTASWAVAAVRHPGAGAADPEFGRAERAERLAQARLLRDIVGPLPFRPVVIDPSWLTSVVVSLAAQMYESRDFSRMLILADALADAGCDGRDVLDHCRGPSAHARGCWVVDAILGRA